jgi:capsular exopolysaccharide synthesis family protein
MQDIQVRQGLDVKSIIATVMRNKWVVLFVFLTFAAVVSYYSLSQPTMYRSSAVLFYDTYASNPVMEILGNNQRNAFKQVDIGYYEVLLTTSLFEERFRDELRLTLANYRDADYIESVMPFASLSQITLRPYKEAAQFFEISAVSEDSLLVQRMVEVATNLLKKRTAELDREGLQSGIQFIEEQIEVTKTNLEKTELSLQALQKKIEMTSKDAEEPLNKVIMMSDKLSELETQVQIRSANLRALEGQLDSVQSRMTGGHARTGKESEEELRLKKQIDDLKTRKAALVEKFGADGYESLEYRKLDEQMTALQNQYVGLLTAVDLKGENLTTGDMNEVWKNVFTKKNEEEIELIILKGQVRLYRQLIKNFEDKNPNLLQDAIDITRLRRSKQVLEETLNSLIKQKENFSIQFYGTTGNLKIVDPAKSPSPIYRKVFTTIFVGSVVGLLIGVAFAFGIEYLDNSIKGEADILSMTNIPIIGKIPPIHVEDVGINGNGVTGIRSRLPFRRKTEGEPEDKNLIRKKAMISQFNSRSFVSERYRTLRTNIQFANIDTPMRSILIGSTGPSEGKTTTAINLAISFADMGHKVCLVDSDLRKPKHHVLFDLSESPGLADIVLENRELDATIQPTGIRNLSILTAGKDAINHSEIFSSMRMSFLMNELEKRFDIVIYDTPPILLLTDSIILSSRVDAVILVVKHNLTEKQHLQNAIQSLKTVRANIIGVVLNEYSGDYHNYYQYAYDTYYYGHPVEKRS